SRAPPGRSTRRGAICTRSSTSTASPGTRSRNDRPSPPRGAGPPVSFRRGVVVVDGVRTPFCKSWGVLSEGPADGLCRSPIGEALARIDLDPGVVDEVIIGNIAQPAESTPVARVAALKAGLPRRVPAFTVNQNCGSGIQAIVSAFHRIESGAADVIVAGGVE